MAVDQQTLTSWALLGTAALGTSAFLKNVVDTAIAIGEWLKTRRKIADVDRKLPEKELERRARVNRDEARAERRREFMRNMKNLVGAFLVSALSLWVYWQFQKVTSNANLLASQIAQDREALELAAEKQRASFATDLMILEDKRQKLSAERQLIADGLKEVEAARKQVEDSRLAVDAERKQLEKDRESLRLKGLFASLMSSLNFVANIAGPSLQPQRAESMPARTRFIELHRKWSESEGNSTYTGAITSLAKLLDDAIRKQPSTDPDAVLSGECQKVLSSGRKLLSANVSNNVDERANARKEFDASVQSLIRALSDDRWFYSSWSSREDSN